MRLMIAAALCLTQVAAPAYAAELDGRGPFVENQRGAFAGVRFKAHLGGKQPAMRASLAVAPTAHSRIGANSRMALGEGLELSFSPAKPKPELTLAGKRLDQMNFFAKPEEKKDLSTLATVAIVAGVVIIVGGVVFSHIMDEASCFHGGDDGDC